MNLARQRSDPGRNVTAIGLVILVHIALVYGMVSGLAGKVMDAFKAPLEVSIVEEIHKTDPPPPKPAEIKPAPPPPTYVPPPEVSVAPPPTPAPVIAATTAAPPPATAVQAPAPTPAPAEPPKPAVVNVAVACPNHIEVRSRTPYPPQAARMGLSGDVLIEFTVKPNGTVTDITVVRSSQAIFNTVAANAVAQLVCVGQSEPVRVRVPFVFKLDR